MTYTAYSKVYDVTPKIGSVIGCVTDCDCPRDVTQNSKKEICDENHFILIPVGIITL